MFRTWSLCNTYETATKDLDKAIKKCIQNGYSEAKVQKVAHQVVDKLQNPEITNLEKEQPEFVLKVAYGRKAKEFCKNIQRTVKQHTNKLVNVIFITNKVSAYFTNKSATPKEARADIVYKFTCHGCEATYYGETERHLHYRLLEHRQPSRTRKIVDHNLVCNKRTKSLTLDEFKIVASNFMSQCKRKIREALKIRSGGNTLNIQMHRANGYILKLFQ